MRARDPNSRWRGRLRRRWHWAAGAILIVAGITVANLLRIDPAYRASASLLLANRTLPDEVDAAAIEDYALELLETRSRRVIDAGDRSRVSSRVTGVTVANDGSADANVVSIAFTVTVEHPDAGAADENIAAVIDRYLDDDTRAATLPAVSAEELEAARLEADQLGQDVGRLEAALEAFKWENAAALPELYELNVQAMDRAERERAELETQVRELESRRVELDRGLRDIQQGAEDFRASPETPLSSEVLVALQSQWAVLRGRYGDGTPQAVQLGNEIRDLEAQAQARLNAAREEHQRATAELALAERTQPIDHPDVVRLAHIVSALESRMAGMTVSGLTTGERRYIEDLARERADIDNRLEELRALQTSLRESVASYESRALEAPRVEQQYLAMQAELAQAKESHEAARVRHQTLTSSSERALRQSPGKLSVVGRTPASQVLITRPAVIIGLGLMLALAGAVLIVQLVERIDRRILGVGDVEKIQGRPPLVEIPMIPAPSLGR